MIKPLSNDDVLENIVEERLNELLSSIELAPKLPLSILVNGEWYVNVGHIHKYFLRCAQDAYEHAIRDAAINWGHDICDILEMLDAAGITQEDGRTDS